MHPHSISVQEAINAHRSAHAADDALYDDNGQPITKDRRAIRAADVLERATLRTFARVPCLTHEDVQAKLAHLLTGTAANQVQVRDALHLDRYADAQWKGTGQSPLFDECLATLRLEDAK
jgi:hypothetical protein